MNILSDHRKFRTLFGIVICQSAICILFCVHFALTRKGPFNSVSTINFDQLASFTENSLNERFAFYGQDSLNDSIRSESMLANDANKVTNGESDSSSNFKYILLYNQQCERGWSASGWIREPKCGQSAFANCKVKDCFLTDNKTLLNSLDKFDALQFEHRDTVVETVPKIRSPYQRYIMWMVEAPAWDEMYGRPAKEFNGFYNWTMTYRQDSDIPMPYAIIKEKKSIPFDTSNKDDMNKHIQDFGARMAKNFSNKSKPIAWFVSNCDALSKREDYVKALQEMIEVDIFGKCGPLKCPTSGQTFDDCWDVVDKDYFFYLSFENSLCKDYITEKFFNATRRNVVPVVMGGVVSTGSNDYMESIKAPHHSFINVVKNFPNPADLAVYLKMLIANPSKYAEYFWWKEYYEIPGGQPIAEGYCDICEKLHDQSAPESKYEDFEGWWDTEAECMPMNIVPKD